MRDSDWAEEMDSLEDALANCRARANRLGKALEKEILVSARLANAGKALLDATDNQLRYQSESSDREHYAHEVLKAKLEMGAAIAEHATMAGRE